MKKILFLLFITNSLFGVDMPRNLQLFKVSNPTTTSQKTNISTQTKVNITHVSKKPAVVEINVNKGKVSTNQNKVVAHTLIKKDNDKKILKIRKEMAERKKLLTQSLTPMTPLRKNVVITKNTVQQITVVKGQATLLSFVDESNNPVSFSYVSVGNNAISLRIFENHIELKANAEYTVTNLIIGIKKRKRPIIITVQENTLKNSYDATVNFKLANTYSLRYGSSDDIKMKSLILKEIYRYNKIDTLPQLDYETYSLKNSLQTIFDADLLKIYRVNKYNKTYYLVLLDKKFKIIGNKLVFGQYSEDYNVYFMNFNQTVFTIETNLKVHSEFKEIYRIVIKTF